MRWRYSGLGAATLAALSLFLLVRLGSTSATDGGAMALDCNASVIGVQSECSYSAGAEFSVDVYLLRAPAEGYVGFQTKVWWDPANVAYLPTQMLRAEALWPHCSIPARAENFDRETNRGQPSVLFGCVPFPLPLEPYHEAGRVLTFRFECQEDAYTDLYLIPRFGDGQLGTHFLDINLAPVDPELTGATVRCGNPPTPTPCGAEGCPTQTPRPRPPTPRPTATEWPTRTPIPPPDVDLESHCSPDAIRPDELALLTCEITVTNHDTIPAHGVRLHQYFYGMEEVPAHIPHYLPLFDLVIEGEPAFSHVDGILSHELPDLSAGRAYHVTARYWTSAPASNPDDDRLYGQILALEFQPNPYQRSEVIEHEIIGYRAVPGADHPSRGLSLSYSVLRSPGLDEGSLPVLHPPETAEMELVVRNLGEAPVGGLSVINHSNNESKVVASSTPWVSTDDPLAMTRWTLGSLAPGEETSLRVTFESRRGCSLPRSIMAVSASNSGATDQHYLTHFDVPFYIGTDRHCGDPYVPDDDTDGVGGRVDPEDPVPTATPLATPTAAPASSETPPDHVRDAPAVLVVPTEPQGESEVSSAPGGAPANGESDPLASAPAAQPVSLPATGAAGASEPDDGSPSVWALLAAAGAAVPSLYLLRRCLKR